MLPGAALGEACFWKMVMFSQEYQFLPYVPGRAEGVWEYCRAFRLLLALHPSGDSTGICRFLNTAYEYPLPIQSRRSLHRDLIRRRRRHALLPLCYRHSGIFLYMAEGRLLSAWALSLRNDGRAGAADRPEGAYLSSPGFHR